jgi:hypothetical protein
MSAKLSLKKLARLGACTLAIGMMPAVGAPIGQVVAIGGHASDIALDESRKMLYIANFTANRIDVLSLADHRIQTSINVAANPSALALSPDGRYLLVTHFGNFQAPANPVNSLTVLDLVSSGRQTFAMGSTPLGVAFGVDGRALVVTTNEFLHLDPATGSTQTIDTITGVAAKTLPVAAANFPANIVASSMATSGDGMRIFGIVAGGASDAQTLEFRFDVDSRRITSFLATSSPPLGPRVVSVNRDGSRNLGGWALNDFGGTLIAQFPDPAGILNIGSHVFDTNRNLIYAQMTKAGAPTGGTGTGTGTPAAEPPVLQVLDPDNLAVLERLQLAENLTGRSVMTSDGSTMFSISESGITVLPMGALEQQPRVYAATSDVVFRGNFCDRQVGSQQVTIIDPGGNRTAFQIASRTPGVTVTPTSGVTPATITVRIDPTVYQNARGTATGTLEITSRAAVNIPLPIRVLINNKEPDQRAFL